mmetsp:Transcript_3934/g.11171  ORF Transcript_3934/g.11171 Transcript_3934/m.11171 type:complete len:291 (-) Transcript_3934:1981-2853(-)
MPRPLAVLRALTSPSLHSAVLVSRHRLMVSARLLASSPTTSTTPPRATSWFAPKPTVERMSLLPSHSPTPVDPSPMASAAPAWDLPSSSAGTDLPSSTDISARSSSRTSTTRRPSACSLLTPTLMLSSMVAPPAAFFSVLTTGPSCSRCRAAASSARSPLPRSRASFGRPMDPRLLSFVSTASSSPTASSSSSAVSATLSASSPAPGMSAPVVARARSCSSTPRSTTSSTASLPAIPALSVLSTTLSTPRESSKTSSSALTERPGPVSSVSIRRRRASSWRLPPSGMVRS